MLPWLAIQLSTVVPRMHVTGGSFAIRVSYSVEAKRKNRRKSALSRSARLLLRKNRTSSSFFFFFFWRPSRKSVVANAKSKLPMATYCGLKGEVQAIC